MWQVQNTLIVGVAMHRNHMAFNDRKLVVKHLCDGRQAIGRARRVADDFMVACKAIGVDADAKRPVDVSAAWSADDDPVGSCTQML